MPKSRFVAIAIIGSVGAVGFLLGAVAGRVSFISRELALLLLAVFALLAVVVFWPGQK